MAISYTAGYTYANGETQTPTKANLAQTARTIECATNKLLGRATAGTGAIEEVDCTPAARALLDDATAADQRATLGVSELTSTMATDRLFGRVSSGSGAPESIVFPDFAQSLIACTTAASARATLGILDSAVRCSSQLDTVSDSTYADIPGLTADVVSGTTYTLEGHVRFSSTGGGIMLRVTGTATASSVVGFYTIFLASSMSAGDTGTSLPVVIGPSAANAGLIDFAVTFACSGNGTIKVQAKQSSANGVDTTSVLTSSYMKLLA